MVKAKTARVQTAGRYVWRDATGRLQRLIIPDPVVKPKGVSVRTIKRAVEKTMKGRGATQNKRKRFPGCKAPMFSSMFLSMTHKPLFEALVFAISACGYRVRCALEDDASGDIRLDKLVQLIREKSPLHSPISLA
jgi:hypothetical protein